MADNVTLDPGAGGADVATDDVGGVHFQKVKLDGGGDGSSTAIAAGGGVEAAALRVTVASDSTGVLSVDDNGGSLTVDNGGTFAVQADTELTTADLDTGAGTDTRAVVGIVLAASGGAVNVSNSNPVPISDAGGNLSIDDGGNSITVDGSVSLAAAIPAGTNNIGDVDVLTLPGSLAGVADDAAFTVGTTPVLPVGFIADQASTDSVNEGDVGAARMTLDRKQIATLAPSVDTEGASIAMNIDVDETEDAVKASAGKILGWYLYNDGAAEVYVKFYNDTVANVVVGTTTPALTIPVPAGSAANVSFADMGGIPFSAAITIAATTGVGTADTGAPAANQVIANVLYV